jgi:hypothetical protein
LQPLLERIQESLFRQLSDRDYRLDLDLREKSEQLDKVQGRRETIGVELYQFQQNLARLQTMLDTAQGQFNMAKEIREKSEESLKDASEKHKVESDSLKDRESNCTLY